MAIKKWFISNWLDDKTVNVMFFAWSKHVQNSYCCRLLLRTENNKVKTFSYSRNTFMMNEVKTWGPSWSFIDHLHYGKEANISAIFWCHLATAFYNQLIWQEQIAPFCWTLSLLETVSYAFSANDLGNDCRQKNNCSLWESYPFLTMFDK